MRWGSIACVPVVVALATLVAGCGVLDGTAQDPIVPVIDCVGVSDGACELVLADLGIASATSVRIVCAPGVCTRAGGNGTATIRLTDGRMLATNWSYTGSLIPEPDPLCVGVTPPMCAAAAREDVGQLDPRIDIGAIKVQCTHVRGCSTGEGAYDVTVSGLDGRRVGGGQKEWWGPGPGATVPPADPKSAEP